MGGRAMAEKILVTGGGGFLGQALIKALLSRGHKVQTLNRGHYPELETIGVKCFLGDLSHYPAVRAAAESCDLIFHVAAKAGVWGAYQDYYQTNVIGTYNVLRACRELGIQRLIFTSSPSVSFAGQDQEGVDESLALPQHYLAAYPATKAKAETAVRNANNLQLATVALRPHLIWGPGDNHIMPRLIDRARQGRLRFIGKKGKKVDAVYIDNAVKAHLCAMDRLQIGSPIAGKVYYVTNDEPWPLDEIINAILRAAGLSEVHRRISTPLAYCISAVLETLHRILHLSGEPILTRFAVAQMSTSHWYNTRAAHDELGYVPTVSMREGFAKLETYLRNSALKK